MINIEQKGSKLIISNFNKKGLVELYEFQIPKKDMFDWEYYTGKGKVENMMSWDNRPIQKSDPVKRLNRFRIIEWIENLSEVDKSKIYEFNPPKKFFCDIEVEIQDGFPEADLAKTPVVSIALSDEENNITVFGTKEITKEENNQIHKKLCSYFKDYTPDIKFKYLYFNSEYDMLYTFFVKFLPRIPFLTGWYFLDFDWKYMLNRCKTLSIPVEKSSLSGRLTGMHDTPIHKVVVDYKEIYEKWDKSMKENLTLDWTAKNKLGLTKVKYPGSLKDLYLNDYELFVFYNAVDTHLVNLLDRKTSVADIFFKLGTLTKSEYQKAFSPVHMTENVLCRGLLKRNLVMIPDVDKRNKDAKYKGAHVHKPKVGLYEYVGAFDFASLYPSVMRQFNISPESFIGLMNEETKTVYNPKTKQREETTDKIVCANQAVFAKETSVLREALDDFYSKRKKAKYESYEVEKEIEILKSYLDNKKNNE
jgi:DNA polymerase elongation subunit (family B)